MHTVRVAIRVCMEATILANLQLMSYNGLVNTPRAILKRRSPSPPTLCMRSARPCISPGLNPRTFMKQWLPTMPDFHLGSNAPLTLRCHAPKHREGCSHHLQDAYECSSSHELMTAHAMSMFRQKGVVCITEIVVQMAGTYVDKLRTCIWSGYTCPSIALLQAVLHNDHQQHAQR